MVTLGEDATVGDSLAAEVVGRMIRILVERRSGTSVGTILREPEVRKTVCMMRQFSAGSILKVCNFFSYRMRTGTPQLFFT